MQRLGDATAILATATSAEAMHSVQGGLAPTGALIVIGAVDKLAVDALNLIFGSDRSGAGIRARRSTRSTTLAFSARSGVRSMNKIFPLERAAGAHERMITGDARFASC